MKGTLSFHFQWFSFLYFRVSSEGYFSSLNAASSLGERGGERKQKGRKGEGEMCMSMRACEMVLPSFPQLARVPVSVTREQRSAFPPSGSAFVSRTHCRCLAAVGAPE